MTPLEVMEYVVVGFSLLAAVWGFYSGWLPRWMRRQIGYYELQDTVEEVRDNTEDLSNDVHALKVGQVDIAQKVAENHNGMNVDELKLQHFGPDDEPSPGDYVDKDTASD